MGGIFRQDSKFTMALNRIVDVVVLNVIFLLTCIPIITIGASLTAMYGVTLKWAKHEEPYVVRTFFRIWKENFVQSTICWVIEIFVFLILAMDVRICTFMTGGTQTLLIVVTGILGLLWLISVTFVFPIIAKFELPIKNILINSICMPLSNLMAAITVLAINVLPLLIAISSSVIFYLWVYLLIMGWFAAVAYGESFFINRIFGMFIDDKEIEEENNNDEDRID